MNTKPSLFRTVIFYIIFFISIPPTAVAMFAASLFSMHPAFFICKIWGRMINSSLRIFGKVNIIVEGKIPQIDQPLLIIANHTGPWETVALLPLIATNFTYVLKKQLISWKYNFFALGLRALKPIAIHRESNAGDFAVMIDGLKKHFSQGNSVIIFPGGTREALEKSVKFGPGGVLLAKKFGCDVLPVYINSEAWSRGKIIKDYGMIQQQNIRMVFGKIISKDEIAAKKTKEIHHNLQSFMISQAESDIQKLKNS